MNIFILDEDIEKCAHYMVDRHVVKMITEYAQMLSTVHHLYGAPKGYKPSHPNHPCTKWVYESASNYLYLVDLAREVHVEYRLRYGKNKLHGAWDKIDNELVFPPDYQPDIGLTPFAQAMPNEYKDADVVTAYRNYYRLAKTHLAQWKHGQTPEWWYQYE